MDIDRLSEFAAVAEYGSVSGAARALGLSAATLSARLRRFEQQLGTPLFERGGAELRLTSAGARLLPSAGKILAQYHSLRRNLNSAFEHSYRRLRIALTGSNLPMHLGPFLDRINRSNPDVHIDLFDDSLYSIEESLLSGEVDLYFAPVMDDFAPETLEKRVVAPPSPCFLLSRFHPLSERPMLSIRELGGEQFMLYPRTAEPSIREFQMKNLEHSGIRYTLYDSGSPPLFYEFLIPVGKGILINPFFMVYLPPNTVCLPAMDLPFQATTCFFHLKDTQNPEVLAFVRDFGDFVKESAENEHHTTA